MAEEPVSPPTALEMLKKQMESLDPLSTAEIEIHLNNYLAVTAAMGILPFHFILKYRPTQS